MDGFLLINKEKGETSFGVIIRVRKKFDERRVGHAGILDKLASGLMLVALGQGTKLLEYLIGMDKVYEVEVKFGEISETFDGEGPIKVFEGAEAIGRKEVERVIGERFLGEINQVPPRYSALKVGGKRMSDLVRRGETVTPTARRIKIYSFKILSFKYPLAKFEVSCSSGTYIRSLINDLGAALKCGAYVKELKRLKIGEFLLEDASEKRVISLEEMARKFPISVVTLEEAKALLQGKKLKNKKIEQKETVMAFCGEKFVGVLESVSGGVKIKKGVKT